MAPNFRMTVLVFVRLTVSFRSAWYVHSPRGVAIDVWVQILALLVLQHRPASSREAARQQKT